MWDIFPLSEAMGPANQRTSFCFFSGIRVAPTAAYEGKDHEKKLT
jgi:hypothetical protein